MVDQPAKTVKEAVPSSSKKKKKPSKKRSAPDPKTSTGGKRQRREDPSPFNIDEAMKDLTAVLRSAMPSATPAKKKKKKPQETKDSVRVLYAEDVETILEKLASAALVVVDATSTVEGRWVARRVGDACRRLNLAHLFFQNARLHELLAAERSANATSSSPAALALYQVDSSVQKSLDRLIHVASLLRERPQLAAGTDLEVPDVVGSAYVGQFSDAESVASLGQPEPMASKAAAQSRAVTDLLPGTKRSGTSSNERSVGVNSEGAPKIASSPTSRSVARTTVSPNANGSKNGSGDVNAILANLAEKMLAENKINLELHGHVWDLVSKIKSSVNDSIVSVNKLADEKDVESMVHGARLVVLGSSSGVARSLLFRACLAAKVPVYLSTFGYNKSISGFVVRKVPKKQEKAFRRLLLRIESFARWSGAAAASQTPYESTQASRGDPALLDPLFHEAHLRPVAEVLRKYKCLRKNAAVEKLVSEGKAMLVLVAADSVDLAQTIRLSKLICMCRERGVACAAVRSVGLLAKVLLADSRQTTAGFDCFSNRDKKVLASLVRGEVRGGMIVQRNDTVVKGSGVDQKRANGTPKHAMRPSVEDRAIVSRDNQTSDSVEALSSSEDAKSRSENGVSIHPQAAATSITELEEHILVLETVAESLNRRHKLLDTERAEVASRQGALVEKSFLVEAKVPEFKNAMLQQLALQEKIDQSLEKSQSYLSRLESSGADMSMQDIQLLNADGDSLGSTVGVDPCADDPIVADGMGDAGETGREPNDHDDIEEGKPWDFLCQRTVALPLVAGNADVSGFSKVCCLTSFWKTGKASIRRLAPLVPFVRSEALLVSLQACACLTILSLDDLLPNAQHRRDALASTLLDIRVMSPALFFGADSARARMKTSEGGHAASGIDPDVALCPYELSGVCADPSCSFQHLECRPADGRTLELLPLSPLRLQQEPRKPPAARAVHTGVKQRSVDGAYGESHHESGEDSEAFLDSTKGFVRLPLSSPASVDERIAQGRRLVAPSFWPSEVVHAVGGAVPSTFAELLNNMGSSVTFDSSSDCLLGVPERMADAVVFCGAVVDLSRVAVHAGRFDIADALGAHAIGLTGQWVSDEDKSSGCFARLCCDVSQFVSLAVDRSFAYEAGSADPFNVAFECQVKLSVASFFLQQTILCVDNVCSRDSAGVDDSLSDLYVCWAAFAAGEGGACRSQLNDALDDTEAIISSHVLDTKELSSSSRSLARALLKDMGHAKVMAAVVKPDVPCRQLVDTILRRSWREAAGLLDMLENEDERNASLALSVTVQIGYVVLAVLSVAAIESEAALDRTIEKHLAKTFLSVDRILTCLLAKVSCFALLETLIAPLLAANVALATTIRLYDRANRRLISLLTLDEGKLPATVSLHLSELLWSQLIQLRMSLPSAESSSGKSSSGERGTINRFQLPSAVAANNTLLAKTVTALGVCPHHLSFAGDWNLVRELEWDTIRTGKAEESVNDDSLQKQCYLLYRALQDDEEVQSLSFAFDGRPIRHRRGFGEESPSWSPFPFSLLLAGSCLAELYLNSCELTLLPPFFGQFFPRLKALELRENRLTELPPLVHLWALEVLSVDSNQLVLLPSPLPATLRQLTARQNQLESLSLQGCKELEVLHVSGNPDLEVDTGQLVAALPKLRDLDWRT